MREYAQDFTLAADHPCLAGHFPGNPVVPAVVLLDWVSQALVSARTEAAQSPVRISAIAAAKFSAPVLPGLRVRVTLQIEIASARFALSRDGAEVAAGRVEFVETEG